MWSAMRHDLQEIARTAVLERKRERLPVLQDRRGEIPGDARLSGRPGRLPGHQPAGAAARADRPAAPHRDAERSHGRRRCAGRRDGAARRGDRQPSRATTSAATAPCSTATPRPVRRSSTSTCTCSAGAMTWPPGIPRGSTCWLDLFGGTNPKPPTTFGTEWESGASQRESMPQGDKRLTPTSRSVRPSTSRKATKPADCPR